MPDILVEKSYHEELVNSRLRNTKLLLNALKNLKIAEDIIYRNIREIESELISQNPDKKMDIKNV